MSAECALCGSRGTSLESALVEWASPIPPADETGVPRRFDTLTRCFDRIACRSRVEAARHPWPVLDRTDPREQKSVAADPSPVDPEASAASTTATVPDEDLLEWADR